MKSYYVTLQGRFEMEVLAEAGNSAEAITKVRELLEYTERICGYLDHYEITAHVEEV